MIETDRLTLRRAEMADVDALHSVFSDARAMRYWDSLPYTERSQTEALVEAMVSAPDGTSDDFVVVFGGRVVGKAGCWRLGEIGFIFHPEVWGQGVAREALGSVIPHHFETLPIERLVADVDPRNAASLALLARHGFQETGRAERTIKVGDAWCDSVYLELTRSRAKAATSRQ